MWKTQVYHKVQSFWKQEKIDVASILSSLNHINVKRALFVARVKQVSLTEVDRIRLKLKMLVGEYILRSKLAMHVPKYSNDA